MTDRLVAGGTPRPSPGERVIGDGTARELARYWSERSDNAFALNRFADTGAIDRELVAQVSHDLDLLRAAVAEDPLLAASPTEARGSLSAAQLTVLLAYLDVHGLRGPQPGWRDAAGVDLRDLTDPLGVSHHDERHKLMASTPVDYLYQQLGGDDQGAANVAAVVERLYELILADAELASYFAGVDLRRVKAHMRAFLIAAVGGPDHYQGRPLSPVHAHLRIPSAHYSKVLTYAVQALTEYHAPSDVLDAVAGKLERLRSDIVTARQSSG